MYLVSRVALVGLCDGLLLPTYCGWGHLNYRFVILSFYFIYDLLVVCGCCHYFCVFDLRTDCGVVYLLVAIAHFTMVWGL